LFKLPVNSSAAVNSLENYGPVNSLSVKNVKQYHFYFFKKALRKYILRYNKYRILGILFRLTWYTLW
jgi:hypothetical protein